MADDLLAELLGAPDLAEAFVEGDDDARALLVDRTFPGLTPAGSITRLVLLQQLADGLDEVVVDTARRLLDTDLSSEQVLTQLGVALAAQVERVMDGGVTGIDSDAYHRALQRLPLPSALDAQNLMLAIAREAVVLDDDLVDRVAEALELEKDDATARQMLEQLEDRMTDSGFGPLLLLSGDRTVHVEAIARGAVLTHTLTAAEVASGLLPVDFDLALFADVFEPVLDGQPLTVHDHQPDRLRWEGPDGWLAAFGAGQTIAVRVAEDWASVTIEPVELPDPDPQLASTLARVYGEEVAEPDLPVPGIELLAAVLAVDRDAFTTPQAPLQDLCAHVGLEVRGIFTADSADLWVNQRAVEEANLVMDRAGYDRELSRIALDVLNVVDSLLADQPVSADQVTGTLESLGDLYVLSLIEDLLTEPDRGGDGRAGVEVLLPLATASRHVAAVGYLAAVHAERRGDVLAAEQHLKRAVDAKPDFPPATDRLAWYASDRGDAVRAAKLWRRLPAGRRPLGDLAVVEGFTRSAASEELSRNAPCWCGSGRKYKRCHLGVAAQAPLTDRVGWLARKATAHLARAGYDAVEALYVVAAALLGEEAEEDDLIQAMDNPLVVDLVLAEGGWWRRFLADRGPLLPADEADLAARWATVARSVHRVVAVEPGEGLSLEDLRTRDVVDVVERTFSTEAQVGQLICDRVLPVGDRHHLGGSVLVVEPGEETGLLAVLDTGDPTAVASWVRAADAPTAA